MAETKNNIYVERDPVVKRISWGAIFAGAIVAIITHITLSMLGLAVGFSTVDPVSEQDPVSGLAAGEMIWWVISGIVAIALGAWSASRLSGMRTGILHGVVTWGLLQIVLIVLLTSGLGVIAGGALNVVQDGITAAAKAAPQVGNDLAGDGVDTTDLGFQQIEKEIKTILQQTESAELQPEQLEQEAERAAETARQAVEQAAKEPQNAYDEMVQATREMLNQAEKVVSDVDKEAVVTVLVKRTEMSREEAGQTVDDWIQLTNQAVKEGQQAATHAKEKAEQMVEEASQAIAETIAAAAWWSFIMLALGAIAAGVGGSLGVRFPKD